MLSKVAAKYVSYQQQRFWSSKILSNINLNMSNQNVVKEIKIPTPYGHIAGKFWNEDGLKTPILALHGWMDNAGTWDKLCPYLDQRHPLLAIDFPGSGLSSSPPLGMGVYIMDNLVTIERVLNYMEWSKVILLGHSMGGGSSLLYAGTIPEAVEKLIVLDIVMVMDVDPENQPKRTAKSVKGLLKIEEKIATESPKYEYEEIVSRLVKSYGCSLNEEAAKTLLIRGSVKSEDGKYSFSYSPVMKCSTTLSLSFEQSKEFASNVNCEFLLVKATDSPFYISKAKINEYLNIYKENVNFRFEVVKGGHHVHLTDPEPVASVVNSFLTGTPQSPSDKEKTKAYMLSNL